MTKLMNYSRVLFVFVMMSAIALTAFAQEAKKDDHKQHDHHATAGKSEAKFLGKGDGVETCPVSGEAITSKDVKAEMFGRTVLFCCEDCKAEALKNPSLYVKPTLEEQRAAIKAAAKPEAHDHAQDEAKKEAPKKFLGKGDGIKTCPVTGEEINKDVHAEIDGRIVYACCEDCLETIKKNPDLYLKKDGN